jgi:hypothetical protein
MGKVLACIGHADKCQALAVAATSDVQKAEYLAMAGMWLELADERRKLLLKTRSNGPH